MFPSFRERLGREMADQLPSLIIPLYPNYTFRDFEPKIEVLTIKWKK